MLDFFRNHKRMMMVLLILVIVPGLGFVGIEGFRGFFDQSVNVASVAGRKITRVDYDAAMRDQQDRARQALGASFDAKTLDTPEMRTALLESMIQQRIVAAETQRLHLSASDQAVRTAILAIPAIAQLRKPDGSIDLEQYKQLLAMQGMTPDQFDERVRYDLAGQQIVDSIQSSAFMPNSVVKHLSELSQQRREVQGLVFKPAGYAAQVRPNDAELKAYYSAHQADFKTPENATIQYLVLSSSSLAAADHPSEADLQKYYKDNIAHYRTDEQVRASHILIATPPNASAAVLEQAKNKAQGLLDQLKAHPDQFAALAKQNSQDPGSAAKGGDLGYFGHGMMVKPFDDAVFKLKKGEISDLVKSDFGYHIIEVTDIKPVETKPYAEVKDSIVTDVTNQQAAKQFAEQADTFTNTVYDQADSLQPAATKFKLQIQSATVSRTPDPTLPSTSPVNNPKFLAALFADDSLKNKHNTSAIDIGNNTLISGHVTDYKPAIVQPFELVKQIVEQKVVAEQAATLARAAGATKLATLRKSGGADGFAAPLKVSRGDAQGLPTDALAAIFKVDAHKLPAYTGVDLGAAGYAIYRVNSVEAGAPIAPAQLTAAEQQLANVSAQTDMSAYLVSLRARSNVKIYGVPGPSSTEQ